MKTWISQLLIFKKALSKKTTQAIYLIIWCNEGFLNNLNDHCIKKSILQKIRKGRKSNDFVWHLKSNAFAGWFCSTTRKLRKYCQGPKHMMKEFKIKNLMIKEWGHSLNLCKKRMQMKKKKSLWNFNSRIKSRRFKCQKWWITLHSMDLSPLQKKGLRWF